MTLFLFNTITSWANYQLLTAMRYENTQCLEYVVLWEVFKMSQLLSAIVLNGLSEDGKVILLADWEYRVYNAYFQTLLTTVTAKAIH